MDQLNGWFAAIIDTKDERIELARGAVEQILSEIDGNEA